MPDIGSGSSLSLISHTNISPTTHHHHHSSPLDQSKSNLPQILHTLVSQQSHIHHGNVNVNQEQLFNFVSHHSLPAYQDCSMEIDCLSENWSSCRYSSYLSAWRTLEIQKIETRNQSEPTFYYGKVSLSAKTEFPNKSLFLWQLSISISWRPTILEAGNSQYFSNLPLPQVTE